MTLLKVVMEEYELHQNSNMELPLLCFADDTSWLEWPEVPKNFLSSIISIIGKRLKMKRDENGPNEDEIDFLMDPSLSDSVDEDAEIPLYQPEQINLGDSSQQMDDLEDGDLMVNEEVIKTDNDRNNIEHYKSDIEGRRKDYYHIQRCGAKDLLALLSTIIEEKNITCEEMLGYLPQILDMLQTECSTINQKSTSVDFVLTTFLI